MASDEAYNLADALGRLKPKDKTPNSARVLTGWVHQAEDRLASDGGRLGWLVAATVVWAALSRVVDESGQSRFLLKGGTMLQYRLPGRTRTTQDLDGLVRGDLDDFISGLAKVFAEPWGPLKLKAGEVEIIDVPYKLIKPRRFDVVVSLGGVTWRRIQVEVSPDEGSAGSSWEEIAAPSLAGFGLPTPDHLVTLAMRYQIAQKVHASTDPHEPPEYVNDRSRDVVDLLLLRDLAQDSGHPTSAATKAAILDIFTARAADAEALGRTPRRWPARLVAYPHWQESFDKATQSAGLNIALDEAVAQVNAWLDDIDQA
jgi:hypothetical protein